MGGLGGFMHSFIFEVLANVRANVSSLGGNGLVAYKMSQCVLLYNPHKNQSQCLINVSGDVVSVSYEGMDYGSELLTKTGDSPIIVNSST
ncbi:hypothetical protein KUTeg_023356 [Tegillarca granosa]|uniref:C2CD5 C-terminal domain-containing protein n=1 Tax=Tegillarca granosa TaxID=220873 RepID=A0ABQ9E4E9_TEGGR|nr:hypothetical protein KUTeg_023356 [Tegillarca granosa]